MRSVALVLVLAAFAGGASAKDLEIPNVAWKAAPTRDEVDQAIPTGAVGHLEVRPVGQFGVARHAEADFRCRVVADGSLQDCSELGEYPLGRGLGPAGRSLLPRFIAYAPPEAASNQDRVFVFIRIKFHDPARRAEPIDLIDPDLLQRADAPRPTDPFPDAAAKAGYKSGLGVVECAGTASGLTGCEAISEAPGGFGFGKAAVATAEAMPLNPWQDGEPAAGARFRVPVYLDAPGAPADPTFHRTAIFNVPKGWLGTAGPYFPDRAERNNVSGSATLQCLLAADGTLSDCLPVSESPPQYGFIPASLIMAKRGVIKAAPRIVDGRPLDSEVVQVEVPFNLHPPKPTPPPP